jgi:HlyD family secretion protein
MNLRKLWLPLLLILAGAIGYYYWLMSQPAPLPQGIAGSNGRIEAVEIDLAAKIAGRLNDVLVNEGDFVTAGQEVARMDTAVLEAQLKQANAELEQAQTSIEAAQSNVRQRESNKESAEATVRQRDAELKLARNNADRANQLVKSNAISQEEAETRQAELFRAQAVLSAAEADVAASEAAIANAKSQVIQAKASVVAAEATIQRFEVDIADSTLKAPRDGRIQYRIAEPGEVLGAGGKVLNMVDVTAVYMTFFLPTEQAGKVRLGADVRIILDAAPQYVIPAKATFVADVAQFTPKTVETAEERQKLMFRIKAHIDPALLKEYIRSVKTGLPGMAYVRLSEDVDWPTRLEVKLPE